MGSVPEPAFLKITGLDNEMEIARCSTEESGLFVRSVEKLGVFVRVQWREAEQTPTLLSILSEIPRAAKPHDLEVLRRDDGTYTLVPKALRTRSRYLNPGAGPTFYELARGGHISIIKDYLEYGSNIIRQYQPDFDYSQSEEQAYLLLHTLERINRVRESVEDLQNYMWYSDPKKNKAVPSVRDPQRDVKATVLRDVFDLNTFRIGEILWFKSPSDLEKQRKHELAAVRVAAQRGRELLHYYFGAEEWRQKVRRIRALRTLWFELDNQPKKQVYYLLAERNGTSLEEEEAAATQDGFERLLDEWISARLRGDDQTAFDLLDKDPRFEQFMTEL
jgi:hypothetical protein